MIRSSIIAMLSICVACSFCGQDFVSLGRHSWRCKQRINHAEQDRPDITSREVPVMLSPNVPVPNRTVVKCCCGKICKDARGLKIHQRSCQVIHGLNDELSADLEEQITTDNTADTPDCSFCLNPETLLHVIAGCQAYLPRFTWRYDSVLNFIAQTLQSVKNSNLFVDLPGYNSLSIVTGDTFRPDLLLSINSDCLYILKLSVGYESNLQTNVDRKRRRYEDLITEQKKQFNSVKFVNLSISSLGVFSKECHSFLDMLNDLGLDKRHQYFAIRKIISIAIRTTYYIFCCRNKDWSNPELLNI